MQANTRLKYVYFLLFLLTSCNPDESGYVYNTNDYIGFSIKRTQDNGCIVDGTIKNNLSFYQNGSYDGYMMKTDSAGNILWQKSYGAEDEDVFYDVQQTSDGSGCTAATITIVSIP